MMSFTEYVAACTNIASHEAAAQYAEYKRSYEAMNNALAALRNQLLAESK